MSQEYQDIAKELVDAVGGEENIDSAAHCATRLRLMVKDKEKIDQERVEEISKVKGAFYNSGQYQIIFGTGTVNRVHEQLVNIGVSESTKSEQKEETKKQGNAIQRLLRTFGDIFVPIIPVLVATGLFMGFRGLLVELGVPIPDDFLLFTEVLTDTAFAFLPALIAWSAFRVFGGSPVIGIVLGLMLVNPALPNAYEVGEGAADPILFFGFIPVIGYQGSVLPAFIAGYLGAKLERWLRQRIPEALDLILTPFLTLLIMITAALFVVGPIFSAVEAGIMGGANFVLDLPLGISGLLVGGLHQVIVITGVHHIFNLFEIQLLAADGFNPFNPLITAGIAAQGGAALAVGLKTKNKKLRTLALPSSLSAFLGITEPAIFGVNLRFVKPFLMGLVGGAAGGFIAAITNLQATGMAITVIPGVLLYTHSIMELFIYILVNITAIAVAFVLTWMFGYNDEMQ
ncbi:sucrose-specific PTS transporter subunit IIBC [Alkalicoccus chagannorensis]|uniref:sucrose-specific PTS transporter subunit IIBC n=1 Tax=Alkalicoccus chagannorensis TaxID=427072 RepID=UPI000479C2BC|nr:sucrose-specific PTS transporter subunit IIBC [Alkalicoccus chagannorensis]